MAEWIDPRPNDFTIEGLRARFKSLQDWLRDPEFNDGVRLGNGTPPTYDQATGVTTPPATSTVDASTFTALDAALDGLAADLDTLETVTLPALDTRLDTAEAAVAAAQLEIDGILPITETDIQDDAITTPKIAANAVTAAEIAANTITAAEIAANTITAAEIAANTITAAEIAANTITANEIAADTITANEMAADSVTANELAALNMAVGKYIRSTTYSAGVSGWSIDADGSAEFNDVLVRGTLTTGDTADARVVIEDQVWANRVAMHPDGTEGVDYDSPAAVQVDALNGNLSLRGTDWGGGAAAVLALPSDLSAGVGAPASLTTPGDILLAADGDVSIQAASGSGLVHVAGELNLSSGGLITPDGDDVLGGWTAYTPTLVSDGGTQPVMLSANRTGKYKRIGNTIIVKFRLKWSALGAGEGTGTGTYEVGLPFNIHGDYDAWDVIGSAGFQDAGTAQYSGSVMTYTNDGRVRLYLGTSAWGSSSPVAQANGDFVSGTVIYELA